MYIMKIELDYERMYTEFPCSICGEYFELTPVIAVLRYDDGTRGDVCPMCLKAGKDGFKNRAKNRIKSLVQEMKRTKRMLKLVDKIDELPTFEDFEKANEEEFIEG